jgi:hypothetical protein
MSIDAGLEVLAPFPPGRGAMSHLKGEIVGA